MTSQDDTNDSHSAGVHPVPEAQFQLRFERFSLFVEEFASHISLGGMFFKTRDPRPVSSVISFDIKLGDGFRLVQGTGEVMWMRPDGQGPDRPAGMGVRFHSLDDKGRELVLKLLEEHLKTGGEPFDIEDVPPGAIDDAEEAQAAINAAFPPLPGQAPAEGAAGLDFDAPWGENLPELPQEILEDEPLLGDVGTVGEAQDGQTEDLPLSDLSFDKMPTASVEARPEIPRLESLSKQAGFAPADGGAGFSLAEEAVEELEGLPDFDLEEESSLDSSHIDFPSEDLPRATLPGSEPTDFGGMPTVVGAVGPVESTEGEAFSLPDSPLGIESIAGSQPSGPTAFDTAKTSLAAQSLGSSSDGSLGEDNSLEGEDSLGGDLSDESLLLDSTPSTEVDPDFPTVEINPQALDPNMSVKIEDSAESPTLTLDRSNLPAFDPGAADLPSFDSGVADLASFDAAAPDDVDSGAPSWPDLPPLGSPNSFASEESLAQPSPPVPGSSELSSGEQSPVFPTMSEESIPDALPGSALVSSIDEVVDEPFSMSEGPEPSSGEEGLPPPSASELGPIQDYEDDLTDQPSSPAWKRSLAKAKLPLVGLLVLAGVIGGVYLYRDQVAGLIGLSGASSDLPGQVSSAAIAEDTAADPYSSSTEGVGGPEAELDEASSLPEDMEPAEPAVFDQPSTDLDQASDAGFSEAAEGSELQEAGVESQPPAPTSVPRGSLTRPSTSRAADAVVDVTTRTAVDGGTVVVIALNGSMSQESLSLDGLAYAPNREQVRIAGITAPYFPATLEIGGADLERIRTGLHENGGATELRLVFDFTGPGFYLRDSRLSGDSLEVFVERR